MTAIAQYIYLVLYTSYGLFVFLAFLATLYHLSDAHFPAVFLLGSTSIRG